MKKYKARINTRRDCVAHIEEVDIERETEKCVWIGGRRNAKRSDYENYYDSWEEAHAAIYNQQKGYVESLQARLKSAEEALDNIANMPQSK